MSSFLEGREEGGLVGSGQNLVPLLRLRDLSNNPLHAHL